MCVCVCAGEGVIRRRFNCREAEMYKGISLAGYLWKVSAQRGNMNEDAKRMEINLMVNVEA